MEGRHYFKTVTSYLLGKFSVYNRVSQTFFKWPPFTRLLKKHLKPFIFCFSSIIPEYLV